MIKINNKISFSYKKPPLIIPEISGNHNGNKKRFLSLIKSACKNGADLIKFKLTNQVEFIAIKIILFIKFFKLNYYFGKINIYGTYTKKHVRHMNGIMMHSKLPKDITRSYLLVTFQLKKESFFKKLKVPLYKIASFEITDLKLIRYIAEKKKPIILSTGMASLNE